MGNQRFSIIPSRAVSDPDLSDSALRTLNALGLYGNREGWCWPSLAELAGVLGKSKQAVSKDIQTLKDKGYLNVYHRKDPKGGYLSNMIQIKFDYPLSTSEVDTLSTSEIDSNAPINAPKERTPAAEKTAAERSPFVIAMEHLEATFANARRTKLPDWQKNPAASNKRWRTPLKEMWDLCGQDTARADILIQEAVSHMLKDNLTFDAPDQILKVARSLVIDIDNGTHRATAPEPIAQTMTRMGKEYREHVAMKAKLGYAEDEPI